MKTTLYQPARVFPRLWLAGLAMLAHHLTAQDSGTAVEADPNATEKPLTLDERMALLAEHGITSTKGPAEVELGEFASLKIKEGQYFIGKDSIADYYEVTQNFASGDEMGVLIARDWSLYFDFSDVGYVKDDEKDKLDADKLMKQMQENNEQANEERRARGWSEMKFVGWAAAPHYDEKTNNLKWAINLSTSDDEYKSIFINESIRLLGRRGIMEATLVCATEHFQPAMQETDSQLASGFSFKSGETYAEFKQGDKVAAYGLTALVLGGGAAVAAKMGLFAQLGVFLGKFWKAIVGAFVAIGVGIKKFFNKSMGRE